MVSEWIENVRLPRKDSRIYKCNNKYYSSNDDYLYSLACLVFRDEISWHRKCEDSFWTDVYIDDLSHEFEPVEIKSVRYNKNVKKDSNSIWRAMILTERKRR